MTLSINTNLFSTNTQRHANKINDSIAITMQRLASGLRINSARDDAAGLAIGTRMDAQVRGINIAMRNANDAISMLQTADGALNVMSSIFQRMRELSVQASNGTFTSGDRAQLNTEYQQLASEVNRIATSTNFNGQNIIASGGAGLFSFQVGANNGQTMSVTTTDATQFLSTAGDLTNSINANAAITALDAAINNLNITRATYGAVLNRLDFTIQNLRTSFENQTAARSRIMDADFAQETSSLSRQQVMQQASMAMLAHSNQMPNIVLNLLR